MLIWIKGAGDLASGIALRLFHAGFPLVMTDLPSPTAVRRSVCFSEAVRLGSCHVEEIEAVRAESAEEARQILTEKPRRIPVLPDPEGIIASSLQPDVIVDAIIAKRNLGTSIGDARLVIGVGPGFTAGVDCHAVIETKRGHTLGRVILSGSAIPNTGIPGTIAGCSSERVFRASADGIFHPEKDFGDLVRKGERIACVEHTSCSFGTADTAAAGSESAGYNFSGLPETETSASFMIPIYTEIDGMIRGMLQDGLYVTKGMKAGDIDPRGKAADYRTVSDKALSVAGGVLEAVLRFGNFWLMDHIIYSESY